MAQNPTANTAASNLSATIDAVLPNIEHIVVLMFENRSFDNLLGGLYPAESQSGEYYGLTGAEWNPLDSSGNERVYVWQGPTDWDSMIMPYPDPGELFEDMNQQIFGGDGSGAECTMSGFVQNYLQQPASPDGVAPVAQHIMQYYAPGSDGNLPITSALAQAYAVSDQWFASGPVQTLVNRIFAHCATPSTYVEGGTRYAVLNNTDITSRHLDPLGAVPDTSIFQLLDAAAQGVQWPWPGRVPWKVYFHDWPISALVKYVDDQWGIGGRVDLFDSEVFTDFFDDVENDLPTYCFIEPRYTDYFWGTPNSNHPGGSTLEENPPPISICQGELLLQSVYTALYNGPNNLFEKTLLIVTYDEHGGLYDHYCPPAAPSPFQDGEVSGFAYTRYGVRVPALLINPAIKPRTIFRPAAGPHPFDHTSIISTLRAQFGLGAPLTPRDAQAPTLAGLIRAGGPLNTFSPTHLPAVQCPEPPAATGATARRAAPRPDSLNAVISKAISSPKNQERVRRQRINK